MLTRREAALAFAGVVAARGSQEAIQWRRLPDGGIQPQAAADANGGLHLLYFHGDPKAGDIYYSSPAGPAIRVNSQPGSAIALGTIRGAQLTLGKNGRPHVAWNGSQTAEPAGPVNPDAGKPGAPMLYARLNDARDGFEPQRNLMLHSFGLDGGGSVAADSAGNVFVAWHGIGLSDTKGTGREGEARRAVWLARSADNGANFASETRAWGQLTGACGCCGMKIHAGPGGSVSALYRSATESVHRDIYLLLSHDSGGSFQGSLVHKWEINACPMSSMDLADNGRDTVAAWETGGQVYWMRIGDARPVAAPGEAKNRKHPRVALGRRNDLLLVWTEGTGWQKGGSLAWQRFSLAGEPLRESGRIPGIPAWSFAAVTPNSAGGFTVIY